MSDFTPSEPRPDDEPSRGRRRFRSTRRDVVRVQRPGRPRARGCGMRRAFRPASRRRLVSGCRRGR